MRLEVTTLLELDEDAERERLQRAFKCAERKALLAILDDFVGGRFNAALTGIAALQRDQREYLHPVIWQVARDAWRRMDLADKLKDFDFSKVPAHMRLAGGTEGSVLSEVGLDYPKVRILPS